MATKESCAQLIEELHSLTFAYKKLMRQHPEQRAALGLLGVINRTGDIRISDLATQLHVGVSTISRQVDYLVDNGLATRIAQQSDGRSSLLHVTPTGQSALIEVTDMYADEVSARLDDWDDTEVAALAELLKRLEQSLTRTEPESPTDQTHAQQRSANV